MTQTVSNKKAVAKYRARLKSESPDVLKERERARYDRDRDRIRSRQAKYYQEWRTTERGRYLIRKRRLAKYGITPEQYAELEAQQNGRCAICNEFPTPKREGCEPLLDVDHCHTSGAVRGLLCSRCNVALGLLREDPVLLAEAVTYLGRHDK